MRGRWLQRIRGIHTYLGVFFAPLLLLFVATGWWQTLVSEDDQQNGWFNSTMSKFSTIHTDDYFERVGRPHHASGHFKIMVGCMAVALIVTIVMGLILACQNRRRLARITVAFLLGILVPVLILYFN